MTTGRGVSNVTEFHQTLYNSFQKTSDPRYIFRGQSNFEWSVVSSAARRIMHSTKIDHVPVESYINYHKNLINSAFLKGFDHYLGTKLSELEVIAELQHHGAATCLIDFTFDSLVALYFSCIDQFDADGSVFMINIENNPQIKNIDSNQYQNSVCSFFSVEDTTIWFWKPKQTNNRILRQHSVFLLGPALIDSEYLFKIRINRESKKDILLELKEYYNLSLETLFCDLPGYAIANSQNQPYTSLTDKEKLLFGLNNIQTGEYINAISLFSKFLDHNPDVKEAYFGRGYSFAEIEEFDNAITDYTKALTLDSDNSTILFQRGLAYCKIEKYDLAIIDYSKAIEINPNDRANYCNRGRAFLEKGDFEKSIVDFNKSLEIDPNYVEGLKNRGFAYIDLNMFHEAIQDFDKVINIDPDNLITYYNRGRAFQEINEDLKAIQDYSIVIKRKNDCFHALYNRGLVYGKIGNHIEAITDFSNIIDINPQSWDSYVCRSIEYLLVEEYEKSYSDFSISISLSPRQFESYYYRGILLTHLSKFEEAKKDLECAHKIVKENGIANYADEISKILETLS